MTVSMKAADGAQVIRRDGEDVTGMLKRLDKQLGQAGVFRAIRARRSAPSVAGRRRLKDRRALQRSRTLLARRARKAAEGDR